MPTGDLIPRILPAGGEAAGGQVGAAYRELVSGGQNVNVAGNWSNSGTYTSGANTVTLDGSAHIISGSKK